MSTPVNHQLLNSSASAEWFTPACYIKAVREVLGAIDLDPASCEAANRIVQARCYFTAADNGYIREWRGNIFLNPPYGWCYPDGRRKEKGGLSAQGHWAKRLIREYQAGNVTAAILLVNANTGEQWFQPLWAFPICFVTPRIQFIPGEGADIRKQPTKSNALVYFGPFPDRFTEVFRQFGRVVLPEALMVALLQANDVASPPTQEKGKAKLEAVEKWLIATLANGPLLYDTIEKAAKGLGISTTGVLRKAKKSLGVKSKKRTYQGEWEWFLPTHSNTRTPLTESAPDKASSSASEAKQDATSTKDVQTSPGVGDNTHTSPPPVVSTPKYARRRSLTSAGR